MIHVPDAPWIREAETFGVGDDLPNPVCPCCGKECDTIFTDSDSEILGCEHCVSLNDAFEYFQNNN